MFSLLEELKQKLNSDNWSDRRDAVRELGQMRDQRNKVVPLLKQRLEVDDDDDVIEEIVKTLKQLRTPNDEVVSLLRQRLEREDNARVIRGVVEGLHEIGITTEQMSHILARNPHFPMEWEMHETAHATAHLGLDSDSNMWDEPERETSGLHETIAQYYTYKLIEKLEDRSLEEVFLALNEKQPERYKFWRYLKDLSPNRVRDFLIGKRLGWFRWDLLSIAHRAAQVLGSSVSLLKTCLSSAAFDTFMRGLVPIAARFENAQSLPTVCEAAEELIQHCETHPFVKELLELAIPRGLHAPAYRALLLVSNQPTKGLTLRLTIDQIINAQALSLTASQLLLRNEIIHGLRAAPELKAYTPRDKAQELARYLPADKNERIQLAENLLQIARSG